MNFTIEEQAYLDSLAAVQKQAFGLALAVVEARIDTADQDCELDADYLMDSDVDFVLDISSVSRETIGVFSTHAFVLEKDGDVSLCDVLPRLQDFFQRDLPDMIAGFLPEALRFHRQLWLECRADIRKESAKKEAEELKTEPRTGRIAYLKEDVTCGNRLVKKATLVNVVEWGGDDEYRIAADVRGQAEPLHIEVKVDQLWSARFDEPADDPRP